MKFFPTRSFAFLTEVYVQPGEVLSCCDRISDTRGDTIWEASPESAEISLKPALYSIKNVPPYLKVHFRENQDFYLKTEPSLKGFAIMMDGYEDTEAYMRSQFSRKSRGNILRCLRRLEKCFDISYHRYYGSIEKERCDTLARLLREMIVKRFDERNQDSDTLRRWDIIEKSLYGLILDKKASLFVVSQNNVPIAISISYHYNSLFFYYITSYDIDYGKFSLGHVVLIKQLEWCYSEGYRIFDMGWGDLDYKQAWCNYVEVLQNYSYLPKRSPALSAVALWRATWTRFRAFLLEKKGSRIHRLYKNAKTWLKKAPDTEMNAYHLEKLDELRTEGLRPMDSAEPELEAFKSLRNEFIYHSEDKYSDVRFYKDVKNNTYYIKGLKQSGRIVPE